MPMLVSIPMGTIGKATALQQLPCALQGELARVILGARRRPWSAPMGQTGSAAQVVRPGGAYLQARRSAMRTTSGDGGIPVRMGMTRQLSRRQCRPESVLIFLNNSLHQKMSFHSLQTERPFIFRSSYKFYKLPCAGCPSNISCRWN